MANWKDPIHPGEILADELEEIGINALELARRLDVPHNRIYQILDAKRSITADTALRLGKFFGTGPEVWMNLQQKYDLAMAQKKEDKSLKTVKPLKTPKAGATPGHSLNI